MSSALCKTRGIVTRVAPYSETSRVVTWITRDFGRLATILKGAQRARSMFLGQVDYFYTCELVFYHSVHHGVTHVARECSPEKARPAFRTQWRAMATASYLTDLVARLTPVEAPHPELFEFLDGALDLMSAGQASDSLLLWLELRLLDQLGLTPRLQHCAICSKALEPGRTATRLAPARGGVVCDDCARNEPAGLRPIRPDLLATLQFWQRSRDHGAALHTRLGAHQRAEMEAFLGSFLVHHLELDLPGRALAFELARWPRRARTGRENA